MGKSSTYRIRSVVWFSIDDYQYIEKLREPFKEVLANNEFLTRMCRFIVANSDVQTAFLKELTHEYIDQIESKLPVKTETVKSFECPWCYMDLKGLNPLKEHLLKEHSVSKQVNS